MVGGKMVLSSELSSLPRKKVVREAPVSFPILALARQRWSPCCFSSDPVEEQKLYTLFETARWAPSSYNEQPWYFVIGMRGKGEAYEGIYSCLVSKNQEWAGRAPILGITVARNFFERNRRPNRHSFHDVGLAMGQLLLAAEELGLAVHQMAGFDVEKSRQVLQVPEGHDPVAAFAIGYMADSATAPEELRARDTGARARKPWHSYVFEGSFNRPWKKETPT
jgi:nitroreductase